MKTIKKAAQIFSQFGKVVALTITGTIIIFIIIQFLSLSLLASVGKIELGENLLFTLFSVQMIPALISYLLLMTVLYILFKRTKKKITQSNDKEIEKVKQAAAVQAVQKFTGIMAEQLSVPNAEIQKWIAQRKEKGQAPPRLEAASRQIGSALQMLTWASFVLPYTDSETGNPDDVSRQIEHGLSPLPVKGLPQIEDTRNKDNSHM